MRAALLLAVALAIAGSIYASLPSDAPTLAPAPAADPREVRGAIHVHSTYSDGGGTLDDIAAAAARAGLGFVIVTDHGDGTRAPEAAAYRSGVLCLDAVEISTDRGHVVAIGLSATPYPLGGEARDVVEDIARLGGMSIAAHPDSPKPELRWTDWATDLDAFEWLNGDSEWRDESVLSLARVLLAYPFARARALGLVLDRPDTTLARWDEIAGTRRLVALAGSDSHARLEFTGTEPRSGRLALPVPTYEDVFRVHSVTLPSLHLTGQAGPDAQALIAELRAGHVYTTVDILGSPAHLSFTAVSADRSATGGDEIRTGAPVAITVSTNAASGARTTLLRDGIPATVADGPSLRFAAGAEPAVYRVEVAVPSAPGEPPVPWIVSNPIYVRRPETAAAATPDQLREPRATLVDPFAGRGTAGWTIESNSRSKGAVDLLATAQSRVGAFRWALGGTRSEHPYVALVVPAGPDISESRGIMVSARASRPMRLSLQLRSVDGQRWRRSIYLDDTQRDVSVPFSGFSPVEAGSAAEPSASSIRDVLLVVDAVNAQPGTNGQVLIDRIAYRR